MKELLLLLLTFIFSLIFGQNIISGTIESSGFRIENANVYLKDTYDGSTSDSNGNFRFETTESSAQILVVEALGYELYEEEVSVNQNLNLNINLLEIFQLESAVITAGKTISSAETSLKPLEVVTTAGSLGDPIGALQFVPGTQTVGEDGRLFVRGGDASETNVYVDRMLVFQPFLNFGPNTAARGRFSAFLFNGINFNTGGYGVQYGNALSGVLDFETIDFPKEDEYNINIFSVGAQAAIKKKWEKDALTVNASYTNLWPYNQVFDSRDEQIKPFENLQGESVYRHKFEKGILKSYVAYDVTNFDLLQEDINNENGFRIKLNSTNLYANTTYDSKINSKTELFLGASLGFNDSDLNPNEDRIQNKEFASQFRAEVNRKLGKKTKLKVGTDFTLHDLNNEYTLITDDNFETSFNSNEIGVYAESEIYPFKRFGLQIGGRYVYNTFINQSRFDVRFSGGYKVGKHNFSIALGAYSQLPNFEYLEQNRELRFTQSNQYIFNYSYQNKKQSCELNCIEKSIQIW